MSATVVPLNVGFRECYGCSSPVACSRANRCAHADPILEMANGRSDTAELQAGIRKTKIDLIVRESVDKFQRNRPHEWWEQRPLCHLRICLACQREIAHLVLRRWRELH